MFSWMEMRVCPVTTAYPGPRDLEHSEHVRLELRFRDHGEEWVQHQVIRLADLADQSMTELIFDRMRDEMRRMLDERRTKRSVGS